MNIVEKYLDYSLGGCALIQNPYNKNWSVGLKGDAWPCLRPDDVVADFFNLLVPNYINNGVNYFHGEFKDDELTFKSKNDAFNFIRFLNQMNTKEGNDIYGKFF